MSIEFKPIGVIHTPYEAIAPFRPFDESDDEFFIIINSKYSDCLFELKKFSHIIVLFHVDKAKPHKTIVHPPNAEGRGVGLFATRSPNRPNPIGMSVVRLKKIEGDKIFTSGMDILNNTPLIDIKPYIPEIDLKSDANSGWLDEIENKDEKFFHKPKN